MSRIRSSNTKPEIILRSALHKKGYRFKLNSGKLPGKPDIVLPKYSTVIFVHGCFWHRHRNCIDGRIPKSNTDFWIEKLNKNTARDRRNKLKLKRLGWLVLTVWECEIIKNPAKSLQKIIQRL